MNRSLLTVSIIALCLTGLAAHADAAGQGGQDQANPPAAAKTPEQLRYEEEQRRYQAEQERHQQAIRESEEARQRYERDRARYDRRMERIRRQQVERGMRMPRQPADSEAPVGEPAAASESAPASGAGNSATAPATAPAAAAPTAGPAAPAGSADGTAPAAGSGSADATAAAAANECQQQSQRNRRRGRRAGGVLGFIARTFTPIGGVAGMVTAVVPVGELLGEAIAGLLDCDEQQRAATATEEAVRGGVGTTANWTSETRPGVTGSSTVLAAEHTPQGDECLTVTDVVIVDGEETRAPKRLCRRPPSSRFVRV